MHWAAWGDKGGVGDERAGSRDLSDDAQSAACAGCFKFGPVFRQCPGLLVMLQEHRLGLAVVLHNVLSAKRNTSETSVYSAGFPSKHTPPRTHALDIALFPPGANSCLVRSRASRAKNEC